MKKYDEIKFKGFDWYYLGEENGKHKLLLKNVLDEEHIKKYYDGDDEMIDGHDVRHQDNIRKFDWEKSYIKNVILENFRKDLGEDIEIDLLTKKEVDDLSDNVKKCDDWYWTKSPYSGNPHSVFLVRGTGLAYDTNARYSYAVRPVIYASNLEEKDEIKNLDKDFQMNMIMAMEECGELIQAISKQIRYGNNKDNICEEIADMTLVIEWLKENLNLDEEVIKNWYDSKKVRNASKKMYN